MSWVPVSATRYVNTDNILYIDDTGNGAITLGVIGQSLIVNEPYATSCRQAIQHTPLLTTRIPPAPSTIAPGGM